MPDLVKLLGHLHIKLAVRGLPGLCRLFGRREVGPKRETNTYTQDHNFFCSCVCACLVFFQLKSHPWSFVMSATQPIFTSLWFLEHTEAGVKLLRTRLRQIWRHLFLFRYTYNWVLRGKYAVKDLLTSHTAGMTSLLKTPLKNFNNSIKE